MQSVALRPREARRKSLPSSYRTPVLNADGRPLSTYPLSIVSAQDAVSAIWQTITSIVHTLLDGADARRWWSVHRQLDLFAEAAPDVFLSAVESSLERNDPPIMALFMADKTPVMGGTYYGDLLGGLTLAPHAADRGSGRPRLDDWRRLSGAPIRA
jgi:hypothetical protein